MSHHLIDPQLEDSFLTAIDGRVKLILLMMALIENIALGGYISPTIFLILALVGLLAGKVRFSRVAKRMAIPMMLALVALFSQSVWVKQGDILLTINLWITDVPVYHLGLLKGCELALRILSGMMLLLFFAMTSPLSKLMQAVRWFRVSPILVELATIMYRYIFLLLEEASRIRTAQQSRLGYARPKVALSSAATLGGMVLLRSYDRAEQSFAAMRCRGYRGIINTTDPEPMNGRDWLSAMTGTLVLILPLMVEQVL